MGPFARVVMQAAPFIGFVTAAILVKVLAARKNKIKKAFEVNELTAKEVKTWTDESNQGELIGRRGEGAGENEKGASSS
jgi:hypothetical protein